MALNSQRTFRAQSLRYPLSNRRVYETIEPRSEITETAEAYFLHVYLPGACFYIYFYMFIKIRFIRLRSLPCALVN